MSLKDRISSPLEAGPSILDAHQLPPQVVPALEHTSSRLAKKSLHLTLVAVRRDYQLPSVVPPSPGLVTPATPNSPFSKFAFASASVSALRQLVHRGSSASLASPKSMDLHSAMSSPTFAPPPSAGLESPRWRWPQTPSTPMSLPPMTPTSTTSDATHASAGSVAGFALRLVHASQLCPKAERALRTTLSKAVTKYGLGSEWLGPVTSPAACGLSSQIYNSSVIQNDVLFSSDGLTVLSLDRLYSLKSALSSYSKTQSPMRLEDAVDELRRLVLARGGVQVSKSELLRCHDWLGVTSAAFGDLEHMYRRAYGGSRQAGGISGLPSFRDRCFQEPHIRDDDDFATDLSDDSDGDEQGTEQIDMAIRLMQPPPPKSATSPRLPVLKLQTNFQRFSVKQKAERAEEEEGEEEEEEERTARPLENAAVAKMHHWGHSGSIDQMLSARPLGTGRVGMQDRWGPMTPKGYDDISPVTRGEWGFLMIDSAMTGKKAGLERW